MRVTVCSAFRTAGGYLDRYGAQMAGLRKALARRGDALTCIWGEGDSTDDTRNRLNALRGQFDAEIVDCAHGGPDHGSVVDPQRFSQLAYVWGRIWPRIPADADAVVFVEADLVWKPETLLWLIDDLRGNTAIAPMVMLDREDYTKPFFYDAWGYRKDGKQFNPRPPYFNGWDEINEDTVPIDSAGSCLAIEGKLARALVWDDRLIVGLCEQIYAQEGQVWLNCAAEVIHP